MDRFALFSTPILVFPLADTAAVNRELAARLTAESETVPGILRSNVGGWHSEPDLVRRSDATLHALMDQVVETVNVAFHEVARERGLDSLPSYRLAVQAWAMVMRDGDYTILHDHCDAHWSTVYYVDAGDTDIDTHPDSGLLAFVDPRRGARGIPVADLFPSTFTVRPQTGTLVVFPGWLQHYVHSYRGTRPRVSISCNVRMDLDVSPISDR